MTWGLILKFAFPVLARPACSSIIRRVASVLVWLNPSIFASSCIRCTVASASDVATLCASWRSCTIFQMPMVVRIIMTTITTISSTRVNALREDVLIPEEKRYEDQFVSWRADPSRALEGPFYVGWQPFGWHALRRALFQECHRSQPPKLPFLL